MTAVKDINLTDDAIEYNGVRFDSGSAVVNDSNVSINLSMIPPSVSIQTTAVYDEADRAVVHFQHIVSVSTIIYSPNASSQASQVEIIRQKLLEPGKELIIDVMGLGMNNSGSRPDIIWGPKPRTVTMTPIGGRVAHRLAWVFEFNVPPCKVGKEELSKNTFKAFNYSISWSNDDEGITVRRISGYAEIAQVRNNSTSIKNRKNYTAKRSRFTAESLRSIIKVSVPVGFKRASSQFSESKDKTRIDFSIVDQQMQGDAYPVGITKASGTVTIATNALTMAQADVVLSMTLTVAPDKPSGLAALHFFSMAAQKQRSLAQKIGSALGSQGSTVIPSELQITKGLFDQSRTSSFRIRWSVTGSIGSLLFGSAWEPIQNTNYQQWRTSISGMWDNRGSSGGGAKASDDTIVNICTGDLGDFIGRQSNKLFETGGQRLGLEIDCDDIDPELSWLIYEAKVEILRDEHKVNHRKAAKPKEDGRIAGELDPPVRPQAGEENVIEQSGYPEVFVQLRFRGVRVGHKPVFPKLTHLGGEGLIATNMRRISEEVIGEIAGCPVYEMTGYRVYTVIQNVRRIDAPKRPGEE